MTIIPDRIDRLDGITLQSGGHDPGNDMCVMEAVAWVTGEDWSDRPQCVSPTIAAFLRAWNDALPDDDRQVLKGLIPRVVGTNRLDPAVEERLGWMAADWLVREFTPPWLRLAGLDGHADTLASAPELSAETVEVVRPMVIAAKAAAWVAAGAAAWAAAGAAAWAAWAAGAAGAAGAAAWVAAGAAGDAAGAAARVAAASEAARVGAGDALAPTVAHCQLSALGLIDRMIAATKEHPSLP